MVAWKNMDTLASYQALADAKKVDLVSAMSGESGAQRVRDEIRRRPRQGMPAQGTFHGACIAQHQYVGWS